ncbi:MAG: hypothetical protein ABIE14_03325 [Patescibacteria group bacterium]
MRFFKQIPNEGDSGKAQFVKRRIRKTGDTNLLATACNLLAKFEDESNEMLVSEMGDLVDALHRSAILVQKTKQKVLLAKLRRSSRRKFVHKK